MKKLHFVFLPICATILGCQSSQKEPKSTPEAAKETAGNYPGWATAKQPETTSTGLKYIDIEIGNGASPQSGQQVVVHYSGYLTNGTKFDSSVDSDEALAFAIGVGQVIRGWDEGVMSMKAGGKRKLIIPPQLGYGERGAPPVIPPNAELIFDVELLEVK
ncbi:FKBP-type peptidyl-prolyl cis-trans isomerase [candidate division KSB1 bacterium]|nr:FKBP-type peptidyl-prolyl cis-trans isomerase [candidate division KSB1 bacterium]